MTNEVHGARDECAVCQRLLPDVLVGQTARIEFAADFSLSWLDFTCAQCGTPDRLNLDDKEANHLLDLLMGPTQKRPGR